MLKTTARRSLVVAGLCAAFTAPAVGAASAYTVSVPGTVVTKPCSASFDVTTDSSKVPPATFTSGTSCKVG